VLRCARGFAGRLQPLCLHESAGVVIDAALATLVRWLTQRASRGGGGDSPAAAAAAEEEEDAAAATVVLIQLTLARGTLSALLGLAEFLGGGGGGGAAAAALVVPELEVLGEPVRFERAAAAQFYPVPASARALEELWEEQVHRRRRRRRRRRRYCMIRTEAVADIPLRFYSFQLRFLL
jgi:hypothetical protein